MPETNPSNTGVRHTLGALADVRQAQQREATRVQRLAERVTATIAQPGFIGVFSAVVALWIAGNVIADLAGIHPIDPPPFYWLQGAASLTAVYSTILILATQRREDELNAYRDHLTLEIARASEEKITKVIALFEEARRESPTLESRVDPEAEALSVPTDARAVVEALRAHPATSDGPKQATTGVMPTAHN